MPRLFFNSKLLADSCCKLSVFYLKKLGMFDGQCFKVIEWISYWTEQTTTAQIRVLTGEDPYVRITYLGTDYQGNSTEYDYRFDLISTPCHFGGVRWWFACRDCGRRVAVLYLPNGAQLFRCRHCYDLTYRSRTDNRRGTFGLIGYYIRRGAQLEEQESNLKRRFYRGCFTKRYRRILIQLNKLERYGHFAMSFLTSR